MLVLKPQNIEKFYQKELSEKNPKSLRTSKPKESLVSVIDPRDVPGLRNDRSHASQNQNDNLVESRPGRKWGNICTESSFPACSLWNCFGMTPSVCQKSGVTAAIREDVTVRGGGPRRKGGGSGGGREMKGGHILER